VSLIPTSITKEHFQDIKSNPLEVFLENELLLPSKPAGFAGRIHFKLSPEQSKTRVRAQDTAQPYPLSLCPPGVSGHSSHQLHSRYPSFNHKPNLNIAENMLLSQQLIVL
jgi:hypothetical protein